MKWNFAIVRIAHLVSLVWCCVGANVQNNDTMNNPSVTAVPTRLQAMTEPINDGSPKLSLTLIITCVAVAVVIFACLIAMLLLCAHRRKKAASPEDYGYKSFLKDKSSPKKRKLSKENVHNSEARVSLFYSTTDDRSTNLSSPDSVEKIITTAGGVITLDNFTLKIGTRCLAEDTKITLKRDDQYIAANCKSLLDLGLLHEVPQVVRFFPDNLKFLKPADLTITSETMSDCEFDLFILHGFYNPCHQRTVWELVTNGIEKNNVDGIVNVKINGFCLFTYILAKRGWLARILSHFNHTFTCRAHAFYRRVPSRDAVDISIVLVSDFVDEDHGENIKQIKDHVKAGYVKKDEGFLKSVHTNYSLEMCLHFPEVESTPFCFKIDQSQLDSTVGFVVDHFKGMTIKGPANGVVRIDEVQEDVQNKSLWVLNISENRQEIKPQLAEVQYSAQEEVLDVYPTTKLTNTEIGRISHDLGIDWDGLAGLVNIPHSEQQEIRFTYPSLSLKAKRVVELYNTSKHFDRRILVRYFEEIGRHDLVKKMLPMKDEIGNKVVEDEEILLRNDTPLSSREMYRLSQRLVGNWKTLGALLNISKTDINEIQCSLLYKNDGPRAVQILAIFNNMKGFSRQQLAKRLEEIGQSELKEPVIAGEWRL